MCKTTKLRWLLVIISSCLLISSGCGRNRTALAPFNSTYSPLAGPTTVAPPPTYSLNIPGANNQNYYNGSGTNQQLPQRQATNTLPNSNGVNLQNGWRPLGAPNATTNSTIQNSPSTSATGSSVLENRPEQLNQTQVVAVNPLNADPFRNNNRIAQNPSANGLSYTDSTNFNTTAVDERLDQSRLPVTDASGVRAPTNFNPTTTVGQFTAPYYVPGQQPVYQNVPQQRFANVPVRQQAPIQAQQNFNRGNVVVGNFAQPTFAQLSQQPYNGLNTRNQVLAQSTVYADPANDPNFQSGWRDRDLTASRDSLNR